MAVCSLPYLALFPPQPKACCSKPLQQQQHTHHRQRASRNSRLTLSFATMESTSEDAEHGESVVESVEDADYAGQHPWDPHKPSFSSLIPEKLRPYPSFEGWYTRLVDVARQFSAGVIVASNYATQESQVTLLFTDTAHSTHAVASKTMDASFSPLPDEPGVQDGQFKGFQWEASGLGKIVMKPHQSEVEVKFQNYELRIEAEHEIAWDPKDSRKTPLGWADKIPLFPCHWYVYSLGSKAKYTFFNSEKNLVIHGDGYAHQEKNWGLTFPAGHVWVQGIANDNSSQIICSGARFEIGHTVDTPFAFAVGYRSLNHSLNFRTNDVGTIFKNLQIAPREGKFSVTAVGPSHTLKIYCAAAPDSFSEQILAPMGRTEWKPACRESFLATIEVQLFEHAVWGVASDDKLVDSQIFRCAALEFGEDLLQEAGCD